jgi:two-component system sensor histidine kinase QseC
MRSINKTITLTTILWVGLILALGQVVVGTVVSKWLTDQFDVAMESKARALVTLTKNDTRKVEIDFADEFMPEFEHPDNPEYFELFLSDGTLLERSHSFEGHPESRFSDQANEVTITDLRLPDGRRGRQISIKFVPQIEDENDEDDAGDEGDASDEDEDDIMLARFPMDERPRAILRLSRERESLDSIRQRFHLLIIGTTLVTLFAIVISVPYLTRTGLRPLLRMKDEIGQITPSSMDKRISAEGQPAEIEPIANQFNLVLNEIEKAFIRERQFSSDVAHELRTPVSEIRSLAEVGSRWPDEKDIRSYFDDIHESSRHLDHLIENLLHLCRSEDGRVEIAPTQVDLQSLVNKLCSSLSYEAGTRSFSIEPSGIDLPKVVVDPHWLELILQNLLNNAISYSPPGCRIDIRAELDAKHCAIEFANPMADPLTAADLEVIFNRFWRKDLARETGRHAGIGLSLVKSYVDLMGLEINVSISDNLFRIRLAGLELAAAMESG